MSKFCSIRLVLLSVVVAPFLQGAAVERDAVYGENVYVNCPYCVAAIFPRAHMIKNFTYTSAGKSVPAHQFYVEQGADMFSVIIADFSNGPAVDEAIVEAAAVPLRQKGEIKFQFAETYDPGIPGRQINMFLPNGRQHRASVYMWDHRLYITESNAPQGDFSALQFEQSVSIIDANGTDLDKNGALPSRQYACAK